MDTLVKMTDIEIWKPIEFNNNYLISSFGRLKRIDNQTEVFLKCSVLNRGYKYFQLVKDGKRHNLLIHRLVAIAFIKNPEQKPNVDHIDKNRLNNNVENLRWCTQRENSFNQSIHKNSALQLHGVRFDYKNSRWEARISKNFLGYFDSVQEAILARENAEKELYGEFTPNIPRVIPSNFPTARIVKKRLKRNTATAEHIRNRDTNNNRLLCQKNKDNHRYHCYDCDFSFGTFSDLRFHYDSISHYRVVLPMTMTNECFHCGKELSTLYNLNKHISRYH